MGDSFEKRNRERKKQQKKRDKAVRRQDGGDGTDGVEVVDLEDIVDTRDVYRRGGHDVAAENEVPRGEEPAAAAAKPVRSAASRLAGWRTRGGRGAVTAPDAPCRPLQS